MKRDDDVQCATGLTTTDLLSKGVWRTMLARDRKVGNFKLIYAVILCLGVGVPLKPPTAGAVLSIPVALFALSYLMQGRSRLAKFIPMTLFVGIVFSPFLSLLSSALDGGREFDSSQLLSDIALFGSLLLVLLGTVWATRILGVVPVMVLVGVGIAVFGLALPQYDNVVEILKFRLGPTLAFIILGVVARAPGLVQCFAAILVLAMGAYANNRSISAAALVAIAALVFLTVTGGLLRRHAGIALTAIGASALFIVGYAYPQLASSGALGEAIRERELAQGQESGLFSGRIEIGASMGLLRHDLFGLGLGMMPSEADRAAAADGFASIGVSLTSGDSNSVLAHSRLQEHIILHSNLFESWWTLGLIAFPIFVGVFLLLIRSLLLLTKADGIFAAGLLTYAVAKSFWDVIFEPALPIGYNLFMTVGVLCYIARRHSVESSAEENRA